MTVLTLVLPFALPPAELAPDLIGHLKAPALAALLSKTSSIDRAAPADGLQHLPHERWLARALGGVEAPAWSAAVMRGFGLQPAAGTWFTLHPAHIEIARSHLLLNDPRQLALADAHARELFATAAPYFADSGLELVYGDAATWFVRADAWNGLRTASPDAAAGLDISFFLPAGPGATEFRKLQNELQMLWFDHPANAAREAARLRPVNAIWPWAGSANAGQPGPRLFVDASAPGWLRALAAATGGRATDSAEPPADGVLYLDQLSGPAIAGDWAAWLAALDDIDRRWCAPLLERIRGGTLTRLTIVLSGRDQLLTATTTKLAQRKFWRRPTLDLLLP